MIGDLQLVFTVRDKDARGELSVAHTPKYTRAIVNSYNGVNGGVSIPYMVWLKLNHG